MKNSEPILFLRKNLTLTLLLFLSVSVIVLVNFVFVECSPIWKYAYTTGQIFTNLSLGYIVSLIFYYLVVYKREKKDRQNISRRISKALVLILDQADNLENMLVKGSRQGTRVPEEVTEICKTTKLSDVNYSINNRKATWVEYLKHIDNECKFYLDKVLKINNVDTDLIKILTELDDSYMLSRSKLIASPESTMEPLAKTIIQFFSIMEELEKYWNDNFQNFSEHYELRRFKK